MLTQNMRPKFKADTYYVPVSGGVYLRGNNNRLVLRGKSLYPLLEHLIPHLNGNASLEEITGGLDSDRKRMVTHLIEKLLAHHFLKDASEDQSHTLGPVELDTYASDIAFIESFQNSAAYRFECFRKKQLLLIGSGLSLTPLIQASLRCGVRHINVIVMSGDDSGSVSYQDILALSANAASEQTVQLIEPLSWNNEADMQKSIQVYDAVLHISEQPMLARAQLLNKLCIEQRKTFIQAILVDGRAWIGPLVSLETGSCWECAWRRLQANLTGLSEEPSHYEFSDQPLVSSCRSFTMPKATMIANRLIFELFKYFTQIASTDTAAKLSTLDLETFLSESHAFLPHPYCLACQHPVVPTASLFFEQFQQLQRQDPIDPDIFLENFAGCVDDKLGLFTAIDDGNFVQLPLAVYNVHLSNPMLEKHCPEALNIIAVSTDTRNARVRAAQKACERYAANFADYRQLLSPERVSQQYTCSTISTTQLIGTKASPPEGEMWTWALELRTQQTSFLNKAFSLEETVNTSPGVTLVPATCVFSSLSTQERGIASGEIWEEAICQALLDWCNYLTVEELKDAQRAYTQVDLTRTPMPPEGVHLYHLLKATGEQVAVYDVTGTLQVPTFATCLGERVVAYSTHCDVKQALRVGFEQALQQYQSEHFQQFACATAPVPDFSSILRSDQWSVPSYMLPDAWSARQEWLLQKLQANGLRAFAIPLNHDPALSQVLPFIVHVLLSRTELKKGE